MQKFCLEVMIYELILFNLSFMKNGVGLIEIRGINWNNKVKLKKIVVFMFLIKSYFLYNYFCFING
mgnify:CR=1 FL=1